MNPTPQPTSETGGRFDSLDGAYSYLYVGDGIEAAIAETLCRDLPLDGRPRIVPAAMIRGRRLTAMTVLADIPAAALHGPHLVAIGQDLWLTKSEPRDYVHTRKWAAAILAGTPGASGLAYRCRHNEDRKAWMLAEAGDVVAHPLLAVRPEDSVDLAEVLGRALVAEVLGAHSVALATGR